MNEYSFVLFTNTYNPHMAPLAEELHKLYGDNFKFIAYDEIEEERKKLGWSNTSEDFLLVYKETPEECQALIDGADIVYFGANPYLFQCIKNRIYNGKLTFFHMERVLKHGILQFFHPKYTKYFIEQRIKPTKLKNVYILSCSSYLYDDLKKLHASTERLCKFGYFPALYGEAKREKGEEIVILCGGRLIKCKHTDEIVEAFARAKKEYEAEDNSKRLRLMIMGTGPEEESLKNLVKTRGIEDSAEFLGPLTPEKVRETMSRSDIFVAASDKREGWGVVINEAMNSSCAVLASREMGSVPYLINDENNGLIFSSGNLSELKSKLLRLLKDEALREKLSKNAYKTIYELWNPKTAALRLKDFSQSILENKSICYKEGPFSED